ncbi:MAG: DNA alkylation repair protein [Leptolyngbya sp. SIO3F4]|nr:DNA alkylation repair protein [Leptolyngbya sp. SIO3F4]
MSAQEISQKLRQLADPAIAEHSKRFFKTGEGEYGEGDRFLGIRVPVLREQAKKYKTVSLVEIQSLLESIFHEERFCALLLLVQKFKKANESEKSEIYRFYLNNTRYINNWDLVDTSAHHIVGPYLDAKDKQPLYELAKSNSLWDRRIAIMATFHFIRNKHFDEALGISHQLITDEQELIHKAVGWMLREIGKRDLAVEKMFLNAHYKKMPRTMLRYAIEKFPVEERQQYLEGLV